MPPSTSQSTTPSTNLILIRHGQAFTNVEPIIAGMKGDAGLTPLGVQQAQRLRDRLAVSDEFPAEVFLASSLPRARQTAEIIAPAVGLPLTLDDELHELRPGDEGDGMNRDEFFRRFGRVSFDTEPTRPVGPGGESWASFAERVSRVLSRIASQHEGRSVVVVCHGGIIDASFLHFFGMPLDRAPAAGFHTHNTSITHWALDTRTERPRWRLLRYNDAAHLVGLGSGTAVDWARARQPEAADAPAVPLPTEPVQGI